MTEDAGPRAAVGRDGTEADHLGSEIAAEAAAEGAAEGAAESWAEGAKRPAPRGGAGGTGTARPRPRRAEDIADGCVHVTGVIASVAGFIGLAVSVWHDGNPWRGLCVLVYGAALVATLGVSGAYNLLRHTSVGPALRRVDHAMIFVMIAATYTPFVAVSIGGAAGLGTLAAVWTVAAIGASLKLLCPHRFERSAIVLYLMLGWTIIAVWEPFVASVTRPAVLLLALGGLLYSTGVVVFLWNRLPFQRAIWHLFVLAAAACHYAAVITDVAVPGALV